MTGVFIRISVASRKDSNFGTDLEFRENDSNTTQIWSQKDCNSVTAIMPQNVVCRTSTCCRSPAFFKESKGLSQVIHNGSVRLARIFCTVYPLVRSNRSVMAQTHTDAFCLFGMYCSRTVFTADRCLYCRVLMTVR